MRGISVFSCVMSVTCSWGQVNNDQVAKSIRLVTDGPPVHTTTASATVEWDCLNQALTGKCLVYHNDQWYTFEVNEPESYYLNISRLTCRNTLGIQVIIIEGNPCQTRNYRVIDCIPQLKNEEVYVPLGKVSANTTYLIEIDGFNGDHCDFDIQVGRRPWGLPMKFDARDLPGAGFREKIQQDSIVEISWNVPPGWLEQIDQFRLFRLRNQEVIRLEREIAPSKNAYGQRADNYVVEDTLTANGIYVYRVYGYSETDRPVLFNETHISYAKAKKLPPAPVQQIVIDLRYDQKVEFAVRVYERAQVSILNAFSGVYDPVRPSPVIIDVRPFILAGHKNFMVVLVNKSTREAKEYYYRVDARGAVIPE